MPTGISKRWIIVGEIDYYNYMLSEMNTRLKYRSPFEREIDIQTGRDEAELKEAKRMIAAVKRLKRKLSKLDDIEHESIQS